MQYALTAAAGALDVFCVTRLGPFASVITGNLVQVGGSVVTSNLAMAVGCAVAVTAFALGVACGAAVLKRESPGWTGRTTLVTVAEFVLLAAVAVIWHAAHANATGVVKNVLLALAGAAMGLQSATTVTSGLRGASTTYLTGTLTRAVQTVVIESQGLARGSRNALRLVALLAGAVAGGLVQQAAPAWAPALPAAIVAVVTLIPLTRRRPT